MSVVAIIDDDDDIRDLMVMKLRAAGHDVHQSGDGVAGLELIRGCRPDLVVLDWMMPGKSGIEVCRDIRSDAELSTTPVLMVTSRSSATDREACLGVGATSVLTKPFVLRDFVGQVQGMLEVTGSMAPV